MFNSYSIGDSIGLIESSYSSTVCFTVLGNDVDIIHVAEQA